MSPKPINRLKSWPEIVPVQAMTARPMELRLELLKRSPKEFPMASSVAPRSTGFTLNLIEKNWVRAKYVYYIYH